VRVVRAAIVIGLSVAMLGAGWATAQEIELRSMDVLRAQLDLDKRAVVADNLVLTEAAAAAFWPIYEDYQRELRAIDEQIVRLVNEYVEAYGNDSVTDALAKRLLDESLALDEAEIALRQRYAARLAGVIPAIEAARYLQIERKIRAVVEFDLADRIPLVE
jgi:Spy/CpxP family protein refolding chaperone